MLVRTITRGLLDAIYPPICLVCGELSRGIYPHCCEQCYSSFEPVGSSCCELCGEPFADSPVPHLCVPCTKKRPPYMWCRGLFRYSGAAAQALLKFKYAGRICLISPLTDAVAAGVKGLESLPEVDLLVPVPLSLKGRWQRGFNQSRILAQPIARQMDLEIREDVLKKRGSRIQVGRTAAQRYSNAVWSYVPGPSLECVRDRKVLLFDDVYTTGATVKACTRALKKAGAEVSVLTFARAAKLD